MTAAIEEPRMEHVGAFRCPKCGNDGTRGPIRYLEDITCYRSVLRVQAGRLEIDGLYRTDEYDNDPTNRRFECLAVFGPEDDPDNVCCHVWPVPPWLYDCIEWV